MDAACVQVRCSVTDAGSRSAAGSASARRFGSLWLLRRPLDALGGGRYVGRTAHQNGAKLAARLRDRACLSIARRPARHEKAHGRGQGAVRRGRRPAAAQAADGHDDALRLSQRENPNPNPNPPYYSPPVMTMCTVQIIVSLALLANARRNLVLLVLKYATQGSNPRRADP
eukprot:scaffold48252_cov49-Phaeocystis_antarctica.AAC.3